MELGTNQDNNKKKKIIIIVAVIFLLVVAAILFFYFRSQITATTMRLLRIEGDVSLEEGGKTKSVKENLRLKNDDAVATATKSLVSIGLDDTKIVTLDESSRAEFNQQGRKLKLQLTDGSLFFEVSKPLEEEESFDIHTSTMVVGIRGTSGWVSVEGEHESLIITDGKVHVVGTNPVTGETKEIDVGAGQRISTYLYNDRAIDSIMFELENITERDLPEFVLERLRENEELLDRVCAATNWDKPWILGVIDPLAPTTTPTPKPENKDGEGKNAIVTPTPTPTQEPTQTTHKKTPEELLEELLALITPTPTPTPAPEPVQSSSSEDDEEEPEPTPTATSIPDNTAYGVDPVTGGQYVNLSGGGTAIFHDGTGSLGWHLEISGADSNGHVKLPSTITDINNNQQGPFSTAYIRFDDVNVKTIDATAYSSAAELLTAVGQAQLPVAGTPTQNQNLERVYNSTTSIDTTTKEATVAVNTNDDLNAQNFYDLVCALQSSPQTISKVTLGSTQVTRSGGTYSGTYSVSDGTNSFTYSGDSSFIRVDTTNKTIVFGTNSTPPSGVVNYDGTIQ